MYLSQVSWKPPDRVLCVFFHGEIELPLFLNRVLIAAYWCQDHCPIPKKVWRDLYWDLRLMHGPWTFFLQLTFQNDVLLSCKCILECENVKKWVPERMHCCP